MRPAVSFETRPADIHAPRVIGTEQDMHKVDSPCHRHLGALQRGPAIAIQYLDLADPGEAVIVVPRVGKQLRIVFLLPILTVLPPVCLQMRSNQFVEAFARVERNWPDGEAGRPLAVHQPARDAARAVDPGSLGFLGCRRKSPFRLLSDHPNASIFHARQQVWVHVAYDPYRQAYKRALPADQGRRQTLAVPLQNSGQ
jgi:hypothetical protein